MIYDVIIIGGGPAGMSAGIYASRSGMTNLIIEKTFLGGQITKTEFIENYAGFSKIGGFDLAEKLSAHLNEFESEIVYEEVISLSIDGKIKKVMTNNGEYSSKSIIITTGATPKKLGIIGEDLSGVSYCATCDGAFYRGATVAVVGGGNTAIEDATFLARFAEKVYLVHRRDQFRADKVLIDSLDKFDNIEKIYDSIVEKIDGDKTVNSITVQNVKNNLDSNIAVSGIFVAVGVDPLSSFIPSSVNTSNGFIATNEFMETNISGIFAAGDVRITPLKQVITAVSDGAIASTYALAYINK